MFIGKYLQEESSNWKYPSIINLNQYLADVSSNLNCFIIVDNFQNVNVNHEKISIILRYPEPFVQTFISRGKNRWRIILGTSLITTLNISATNTIMNLPCSVQKFVIALNPTRSDYKFLPDHLCLVLDHVQYFLNAKPNLLLCAVWHISTTVHTLS